MCSQSPLPAIERNLHAMHSFPKKAFDLGCGNGAVSNWMHTKGIEVTAVDPSPTGIDVAKAAFPEIHFHVGSSNDSLAEKYGRFPLVISMEVVEHVYAPRQFAECIYSLLEPGGYAFVSTPYHGYLKNVVLALSGKMDKHFTALWDNGHIKFWSRITLAQLLSDAGLSVLRIERLGRIHH